MGPAGAAVRWGIREYHAIAPDGTEALVVAILIDRQDGSEPTEYCRFPGTAVRRIRGLLQMVEAAHPDLVGPEPKPVRGPTRREVIDLDPDATKH